jgi:hypothetical protein
LPLTPYGKLAAKKGTCSKKGTSAEWQERKGTSGECQEKAKAG